MFCYNFGSFLDTSFLPFTTRCLFFFLEAADVAVAVSRLDVEAVDFIIDNDIVRADLINRLRYLFLFCWLFSADIVSVRIE